MPSTPKEIVCEWLTRAWNAGADATIDRLMTPTTQCHGLPTADGGPLFGPGEFGMFARRIRSAFPDLQTVVVKTISEGEFVAVHCRVTGTHLGPGLDVPPTRKPVRLVGVVIAHVRNGRIVELWNSFDFLALYRQTGATGPAGILGPPAARSAVRTG